MIHSLYSSYTTNNTGHRFTFRQGGEFSADFKHSTTEMACLGSRRGGCRRWAGLMSKEVSHVNMPCWLLGCADVLTACEHNAAWASDKRQAIKPMACKCLHCAQADAAVASALDEATHLRRAACPRDAPLLLSKLGGLPREICTGCVLCKTLR